MKAILYLLFAMFGALIVYLTLQGITAEIHPVGMQCDHWMDPTRPCPFGPGIVGVQECRRGMWDVCEAPRTGTSK